MSTYHILLKRGTVTTPSFEGAPPSERPAVEVGIDERSGHFDLHVYSEGLFNVLADSEPDHVDPGTALEVAEKLSCADLRAIRDRINEVLSYFDEETK